MRAMLRATSSSLQRRLGMPVIGCRLMPPRVSQHQGYEEHGLRLTPRVPVNTADGHTDTSPTEFHQNTVGPEDEPRVVPFTGLWMVDKIRPDLADVRVFIDTHPDRSVNRDTVTLWLGLHQLGCVISPRVGTALDRAKARESHRTVSI